MGKSEDCPGLMSNSKNGHDGRGGGRKLRLTLTLSQIKLAVALELRAEGFETVVFDRVVEFGGRKVRVHVLCEDEDGVRLAVYCIHRANLMDPHEVFAAINAIRNGIEECTVALAFPLVLLPRASPIIGMTSRVFMVDSKGRVWNHYPWQGSRLIEVFREAEEALLEREEDECMLTIKGQSTQMRGLNPFYII